MSNPTDWLQIYHQNLRRSSNAVNGVPDSVPPPDATVITDASTNQFASSHLSPDQGRVSKPVRRRTRASRRTPTTLLNTDTSNFRAMVQQFTGGSSAPFAQSSSPGPSNLNFGFGQARQPVNQNPIVIPPEYHIPSYRNLLHSQNQQQFMFSPNSNNQSNPSAASYGFPPTLDGSRPANLMGQSGEASIDGVFPESENRGRGNNFIR